MGEVITFAKPTKAKAKPIPQTVTESDMQWLMAASQEYLRLANQFPEGSELREALGKGFLNAAHMALEVAKTMGVFP